MGASSNLASNRSSNFLARSGVRSTFLARRPLEHGPLSKLGERGQHRKEGALATLAHTCVKRVASCLYGLYYYRFSTRKIEDILVPEWRGYLWLSIQTRAKRAILFFSDGVPSAAPQNLSRGALRPCPLDQSRHTTQDSPICSLSTSGQPTASASGHVVRSYVRKWANFAKKRSKSDASLVSRIYTVKQLDCCSDADTE